jgi:diguanylate cyclase (GGDEF)-like protein/PAS domain S-box-containing protein
MKMASDYKKKDFPANRVIATKKALNEYMIGIKPKKRAQIKWALVNAYLDSSSNIDQIIVTFTEISKMQNIVFKEFVDNALDAMIITSANPLDDPHGPTIEYVNDTFCEITGYTRDEVIGKTPRILQRDDIDREALGRIKDALKKQIPVRETLLNYSKEEHPYWLDISIFPLHAYGNKVTHFAAIERDISQIKHSELSHLEASQSDALTSLLNRRGFDILVKELFVKQYFEHYSIIAIDIDRFKGINDTYGHAIGDIVLVKLAEILQKVSRRDDLVVRFGGEEFIILLPHVNSAQSQNIAQRIRKEAGNLKIQSCKDNTFQFTISLGVAQGVTQEELPTIIANADLALYEAKALGRNRVEVFSQALKCSS